jgi:hypothetical protein
MAERNEKRAKKGEGAEAVCIGVFFFVFFRFFRLNLLSSFGSFLSKEQETAAL